MGMTIRFFYKQLVLLVEAAFSAALNPIRLNFLEHQNHFGVINFSQKTRNAPACPCFLSNPQIGHVATLPFCSLWLANLEFFVQQDISQGLRLSLIFHEVSLKATVGPSQCLTEGLQWEQQEKWISPLCYLFLFVVRDVVVSWCDQIIGCIIFG